MEQFVDKIDYENLLEKALKHVVIDALKIAEKQGLPGEHHFYISFKTKHFGIKMDETLLSQYPDEMTIVLQNQFENLQVGLKSFSVTLRFNHVPYTLTIPFDAITYFGDPSVRFGLSFGSEIDSNTPNDGPKAEPQHAEVVSIDAFRKKGNA